MGTPNVEHVNEEEHGTITLNDLKKSVDPTPVPSPSPEKFSAAK